MGETDMEAMPRPPITYCTKALSGCMGIGKRLFDSSAALFCDPHAGAWPVVKLLHSSGCRRQAGFQGRGWLAGFGGCWLVAGCRRPAGTYNPTLPPIEGACISRAGVDIDTGVIGTSSPSGELVALAAWVWLYGGW